MNSSTKWVVMSAVTGAVALGYLWGHADGNAGRRLDLMTEAKAAETPTGPSYRAHYYPGTEELRPDEMRVIALGTGMPTHRVPRGLSDASRFTALLRRMNLAE